MKLISKPGKHEKKKFAEPVSTPREQKNENTVKRIGKKPETTEPTVRKVITESRTEAPAKTNKERAAVAEKHTTAPSTATAVKEDLPKRTEADNLMLSLDDEWGNIFSKSKRKDASGFAEEALDPKKDKYDYLSWDAEQRPAKNRYDRSSSAGKPSRKERKKAKKAAKKEARKKRSPIKKILRFLLVIAILAGLYLFFVYTKIPFIASARDSYIETAMSTMSHQWMAEWFFPKDVIDEVVSRVEAAQEAQAGIESDWSKNKKDKDDKADKKTTSEKEAFYQLFWEIDRDTFEDYISDHPEVLDHGWDNIYINEAGIEDSGTSIWTTMNEQVLAIDVPNKILLIRVEGSGYQGVLAVAKDSSRLSCTPSQNVGAYGEQLESIMKRTNAVLGMTGSGFIDENGNGNGGSIVGFARCQGKDYGARVGGSYKRIELRDDNLLYIVDSSRDVDSATTDAVEFAPALVVNGEPLIDQLSGYTSINPRACIGQSENGEILMLVIEGRLPSRSFGCGLPECTDIFIQHKAYQAMNLDGGTSAIMWYRGEYVIKCSNTAISCRTLPNAWIYS